MDTDDTQDAPGGEQRPTDRRPLGYWLRVVDELLTREVGAALGSEGVTRSDWMLLNILAGDVDGPSPKERQAGKGKRLRTLAERGWAEQRGDGTWTLTDEGRAAKDRLGEVVDGLRTRLVDAVGADAFATTMASLEAMARELGWDEDRAAEFFPGPGRLGGWGGPRPFRPEIRYGWGPNRHHGFEPGRPGHPGRRPDAHEGPHDGFDEGCHGPWSAHGYGFGHGHRRGGHHHQPHGHGSRKAERAYERGFDAGFERGRQAGAA